MRDRMHSAMLNAMTLELGVIALAIKMSPGDDGLREYFDRKKRELEFWKIIWDA